MHSPSVCEAEFRTACSKFPTGVSIATVVANQTPYGMTVASFTSVSLDPCLVLVCIDHRAQMAKLLSVGTYIGINVLANDQQALSERFSKNWRERFAGISWYPGSTGVPLLTGVLATFECCIGAMVPAGDHLIVIAQVVQVNSTNGDPLVYVNRCYTRIAMDDPRRGPADGSHANEVRAVFAGK